MKSETKKPNILGILNALGQSKLLNLEQPVGMVVEKLVEATSGEENWWAIVDSDGWVLAGPGKSPDKT